MMQTRIDNKRIAKNTIYLYVRMLISMGVSLYTARVVINVLGIEDFGIYSVVGGVVVLFSFVSTALKNSTQRFISFYLGQNDMEGVNKSMSVSLKCHALFALVFVLLSLTVGLWFVANRLNLPAERYDSALYVYYVSIVTFVVSIFQSPYQAAIISYEKMSFFAYISIFDVVLKLVIVFALMLLPGDKLICYSLLLLLVSVVSLLLPLFYCYHTLRMKRLTFVKDRILFRQMLGYSGWSMCSGFSYVGAQQGGNFLINIFGDVVANGAFGIANQATNVLYGFVSNFLSAINPQIVKSYSARQYKDLFKFVNRTSCFSYYIFLLIAIPILIKIDYILELWLGTTPAYASGFCRLMILYFFVDSFEAPLWMLIGATGKMKGYSIWVSVLTLLSIPLAWMMLYLGYNIYWVFIIRVFINSLMGIIRPFYLKHLMKEFSLWDYWRDSLSKVLLVTFILSGLIYAVSSLPNNFNPFLTMLISGIITAAIIWFVGISQDDKNVLIGIVKTKMTK